MTSVTWNDVRARRLARNFLTEREGAERLVNVVRGTCGIHAQIMGAAELSLCARVDGVTQEDVRDALWRDRALVKAWTLRGTLHLHPAGELPLWYAARRAVAADDAGDLQPWRDPSGVVHPALSPEEATEIRAAVREALDGRCLLREELAAEVVERVGPRPGDRLRSGFAFFIDEVCQGPPQGNKITLVRPDQWIEGWHDVDEQEALREVCLRFLRTYGPSRPAEFREWFTSRSFTAAAARALFESLEPDVEHVDVEGRPATVVAGDSDFPKSQPTIRLLPEYDVYVMGFRERDQLVPDDVRAQVAAHGRGRYEGPAGVRFLLINGVMAGLWERKKRGKRIELQVTPSRKVTRAERAALDTEAERIGAFLGLEAVLTIE